MEIQKPCPRCPMPVAIHKVVPADWNDPPEVYDYSITCPSCGVVELRTLTAAEMTGLTGLQRLPEPLS